MTNWLVNCVNTINIFRAVAAKVDCIRKVLIGVHQVAAQGDHPPHTEADDGAIDPYRSGGLEKKDGEDGAAEEDKQVFLLSSGRPARSTSWPMKPSCVVGSSTNET